MFRSKSQTTTEKDELNALLADLNPKAAVLDTAQQERMWRKISGRNSIYFNLFSLFMPNNLFSKKRVAVGFTALGTLVCVSALGFVAFRPTPPITDPALLEQLALANTKLSQSATPAETSTNRVAASTMLYIDPATRGYNFADSTYNYETGAALEKCSSLYPVTRGVTRVVNKTFFGENEVAASYVLREEYAGDTLVSYSLQIPKTKFEYRGGKFAAKHINYNPIQLMAATNGATLRGAEEPATQAPAGLPQPEGSASSSNNAPEPNLGTQPPAEDTPANIEPGTATSSVTQSAQSAQTKFVEVFGEGAQVVGTKNIGGQEYFVVRQKMQLMCNPGTGDRAVDSNTPQQTILIDNYARKDNMEISRQEYYFDSAHSTNLIYSHNWENKTSTTKFDQVKANFEFKLGVETKEYDDSLQNNTAYLKQALQNYLQTQKFKLALPNAADWTLNNLYAREAYPVAEPYLTQIDFYGNHAANRSMLENMQKAASVDLEANRRSAKVSVSYNKGESIFNLDVYTPDVNIEQVLPDYVRTGTKVLNIGGQEITANVITPKTKEHAYAQTLTWTDSTGSYVVTLTPINSAIPQLASLDLANNADVTKLLSNWEQMQKKMAGN
jgi:hypothetical protein